MQEIEKFLNDQFKNVLTSFLLVHYEQNNSCLDLLYEMGYVSNTLNRIDITNFVGEIFKIKDVENIKKLIDIVYYYEHLGLPTSSGYSVPL